MIILTKKQAKKHLATVYSAAIGGAVVGVSSAVASGVMCVKTGKRLKAIDGEMYTVEKHIEKCEERISELSDQLSELEDVSGRCDRNSKAIRQVQNVMIDQGFLREA